MNLLPVFFAQSPIDFHVNVSVPAPPPVVEAPVAAPQPNFPVHGAPSETEYVQVLGSKPIPTLQASVFPREKSNDMGSAADRCQGFLQGIGRVTARTSGWWGLSRSKKRPMQAQSRSVQPELRQRHVSAAGSARKADHRRDPDSEHHRL